MRGLLFLGVLFACLQAADVAKPVFKDTNIFDNLIEDIEIGTSLGFVEAFDPDPNGRIVEYFIRGSADHFLMINKTSGEVLIKNTLDFEEFSSIRLQIYARDADGELGEFDITIQIKDANDNAPQFSRTVHTPEPVPEDAAVGYVVDTLTVTDRDNANRDLEVYCDTSKPQARRACEIFIVVKTTPRDKPVNVFWTGNFVLNHTLDYELEQTYAAVVIAYDGLHRVEQPIVIEVLDINDAPPRFERAQSSVIDEREETGTEIDYVIAKDTDISNPRPIRYELYGGDDYFAIDDVTGVITNIRALDYDDPAGSRDNTYTLNIRARELLPNGTKGNDIYTTAVAEISIRLRDINDNCPVFDKETYVARIDEIIEQGVNIPGVEIVVRDRDSDKFGSYKVELFPSNLFSVTPERGQSTSRFYIKVLNAAAIDFEELPNEYSLRIIAVEDKVPPLEACTANATIAITILDANDNTPVFGNKTYRSAVIETAPAGYPVITVSATDKDSGNYGQNGIVFDLLGKGEDLFFIDRTTGVITVAKCDTPGVTPCLDYETKTLYDLAVRATDNNGASGGNSQISRLLISVLNRNDNPPQFTDSYKRLIMEKEVRTTEPLIIQALDLDGDTVTYSIPSGQDGAKLWRINSVTGEIEATRPIEYSDAQDGVFRFLVVASDGGNTDMTVDIEIKVIDINDKDPYFIPSNYTVSIPESTPGGTSILQVSVGDGDSPSTGNGVVFVQIESGSLGKFALVGNRYDPASGLTFVNIFTTANATFDTDTQPRYRLLLKVQDQGQPEARTALSYVTINIIDVNNKKPYFDPPTHSIAVRENEPIGKEVVTVYAYDKDEDFDLRYSFMKSDIQAYNQAEEIKDSSNVDFTEWFRIESETGVVRVNAALDRDLVSLLQIPLLVEDVKASGQSGTGMLFIRILEYNDQAPYFEKPLYEFAIKEEQPAGAFVGALLALDEDDPIDSYTLSRNPGDLFTVVADTGVLLVNKRLDYEERHNVTLVAMAFDGGSPKLSNTTTIFVRIINWNDNTPRFLQSSYKLNLLEEQTTSAPLHKVSATDADEEDYGIVRYRLDPDEKYFAINEITGEITYKPGHPLFDREKIGSYSFQVTAYDSPNTPNERLITSVPVYVDIEDINDNCPTFQQDRYVGLAIETADIGDQVLELHATDLDSLENANLRFAIDRSTAQPAEAARLFRIHAPSGRIEVGASLRDRPGKYGFLVTASDLGGDNSTGQMCSVSVPVEITVQEAINDAPVWVRPPTANYTIDVLESQYKGMLVYDCKATDPNPGNAGIVEYSFNVRQQLVNNTDEFHINHVTCIIRARIVYDREAVESYVLTIVAKDKGNPSASSETVIIIRVLDVNDNDPEFPMREGQTIPYNWDLQENTKADDIRKPGLPTGVIGRVEATDKDTDHPNNKINYKIVAGNRDGYFLLDKDTGEFRLNRARVPNGLDREFQGVYSMEVLAYNDVNDDTVIRQRRRRSTNPSIVTVNIALDDVNDTPPVFLEGSYRGCVPTDAPFAQSILQVEASDEDLVGAQVMQYTLAATSDHFLVEPTTGIIRNNRLLYDLGASVQSLTVTAFDGAETSTVPVTIFVTDPKKNEVKLLVSQPSSDVRVYQDQLISVMQNTTSGDRRIVFGCIHEIQDRVNDDGSVSFASTDVMLSAIGQNEDGTYFIFTAAELADILSSQLASREEGPKYQSLYIKGVQVEEEDDELSLTEDPVLAVFIIAILLIFLALLLFILACCLIRNSKKKKIKKLRAEQHTQVEVVRQQQPEVIMSVNPVYDNKGYQPDPAPAQVVEDEYAVVNKRRPHPDDREPQPLPAVVPPIVPVVVPAPDDESPDIYIPEAEPAVQDPEPVIITEPIMENETPEMQPPPADFFTQDTEPEPVIETEFLPEDDYPQPGPSHVQDDEIEVEIRDSPPDSPPHSPSPPRSRSPSPPASPREEYRIETNVM